MKKMILDLGTTQTIGKVVEAFKMYQREYLCKSEKEADAELAKFIHCHEYVTNNKY